MKLQRITAHPLPALTATKGKMASSPGKIKAAAPAKEMVPHNGEDRVEQIRQRAYALYTARNRVDGYELEDWLRAEVMVDRVSAPQVAKGQPEH